MAIAEKNNDLALAEAINARYKLENKKKGYAIASIKEKGVYVATQLLASKLMRKCHIDKLPVSVIALAKQ